MIRSLRFWALALLAAPSLASAQHRYAGANASYDPAVPTPRASLGYEVGDHFTPHHRIMRYLEQLAATSKRIRVDTLGVTAEGREIVMATLTSERNMARLADIKADAKRLADPRNLSDADQRAIVARQPSIVWLGYSVHGNEASGVEAGLAMLYQLAAGRDAETMAILDSAVVLIDPVQNPDGHERHVQDVLRNRSVFGADVTPGALIHQGNWPGGRTSHYYFDLNRDWFIHSHPESRARTGAMLDWWPQVAIDLHEMGSNSTYFFAPPMEPYNKNVPPATFKWWDIFASGIGQRFDRDGWAYFRREGYDEFYPGYGVSWPILLNAIGATFEQASSGGGAIRRSDGSVLTLAEAASHHYAAAWAMTLTAAQRRTELVGDYVKSRQQNVSDLARSPMRAVILARDTQGRADSLAWRLMGNGIEVQRITRATAIPSATAYGARSAAAVNAEAGWYVVDLAQPQGRLAKALLEPDAQLDSTYIQEELESRRTGQGDRFYDITGWSLPHAFRVRAYTAPALPAGLERVSPIRTATPMMVPVAQHGWAFEAGSEASYRLLGGLFRDGVKVWYAPKAFRVGSANFPNGAFIVRVAGNGADVHAKLVARVRETAMAVQPLATALVDAGADLGSNSVIPVNAPKVLLVGGNGVNGNSFGFSWYTFEQRLGYPATTVNASFLAGSGLEDFDVVVLPSVQGGAFESQLGEAGKERLQRWVRDGGVLITLQGATNWLASERSGLSRFRVRPDTGRGPGGEGAPLPVNIPGAIARTMVDPLSPLMAGVLDREIAVLVSGGTVLQAPRDLRPGERVLRFPSENEVRLAGYFWPEGAARLAGSAYLFTERVGQGRVIAFRDDPNFRDLWRGLLPVFANAVFLGGAF
ncbi:MAG: hypothetical protein C0503_03720 [Gemmatimonas sp.]|nr:hypothetical protein [Gemmatimonas sp.]